MNRTCTCIVPFFNEEKWIVRTLNKLIQIPFFDSIVTVDDGSNDLSKTLVQQFIKEHPEKHIVLVSYPDNKGKSHAVAEGLKKVKTDYVFLFDADLTNIKTKEINTLISSIYDNPEIDMGILRRIYAKRYIKFLYRELILSGQRMLKTNDLKTIFTQKFDKYQLEIAINTYMQKHKKTVVWYPFSGNNSFKTDKRGFWDGWKRNIFMYKDIIGYQWIYSFLKQVFLFDPCSIKTYSKKNK